MRITDLKLKNAGDCMREQANAEKRLERLNKELMNGSMSLGTIGVKQLKKQIEEDRVLIDLLKRRHKRLLDRERLK